MISPIAQFGGPFDTIQNNVAREQALRNVPQFDNVIQSQLDKLSQAEKTSESAASGDVVDFSNASNFYGVQAFQASFEVSYQSASFVSDATGQSFEANAFSFSASFEYLEIQAGGQGSQFDLGSIFDQLSNLGGESNESGEGEGVESTGNALIDNAISAIQDFFSPSKTAGRILNFALSGFGNSSFFDAFGDTEQGRGGFADFIGGAINKGFDEAQAILGDVNEKVQSDIDETYDTVFSGLEDFVKNGKSEDAIRAELYEAFSFELDFSISTSSITFNDLFPPHERGKVNGQAVTVPPANVETPSVEDAATDVPVEVTPDVAVVPSAVNPIGSELDDDDDNADSGLGGLLEAAESGSGLSRLLAEDDNAREVDEENEQAFEARRKFGRGFAFNNNFLEQLKANLPFNANENASKQLDLVV